MAKQPANDPQLKKEVKDATQAAEHDAKTGNVATVKETAAQPVVDLPTGTRRDRPAS